MSDIFDQINSKLLTEVSKDDYNPLIAERTSSTGQTVKFRTAAEIAQFATVQDNRAAAAERETSGIMSRIEMDPLE